MNADSQLPHVSALQSDAMDHGSEIMDCEAGKNLHERKLRPQKQWDGTLAQI